MKRITRAFGLVALALVVGGTSAQAQGPVGVGYSDVGLVLGLGGTGDAGLAYGIRYEKAIKTLPEFNDGVLGIQLSVDYWSWSYRYFGTQSSSLSYIPIGVTGNYHFKSQNEKLDTFVGAGLGYEIVNASCTYLGVDYCGSYSSAIYVIFKAGLRYFTSEKLAFYADVGAGAATLNIGAVMKLGGGS